MRVALALALAAALGGAVLLARSAGSGRAAVLPVGAKTGVIVLDMSASVAGPTFERIATVMRGLSPRTRRGARHVLRHGLRAPSAELADKRPIPVRALLRLQCYPHGEPVFGRRPWNQFSGGTRISSGLRMGLDALRRAHVAHGSLLLISDLNDSSADAGSARRRGSQSQAAHFPVRIIPVGAAPGNVRIFTNLFGRNVVHPADGVQVDERHQVEPVAALVAMGPDRGRPCPRRATRRERALQHPAAPRGGAT